MIFLEKFQSRSKGKQSDTNLKRKNMTSSLSKTKKGLILGLLFLTFFVSMNFNLLLEKSAMAQGVDGALQGAKSAIKAGETASAVSKLSATSGLLGSIPVVETRSPIDEVLVGVWKSSIYPLIRRLVISLITKGDFGLTWEGIKDWFYKDLIFQTAERILNQLGLSLCAKFSLQIRVALMQSLVPLEPPACTFQQSEFAQIIDDALTKGGEAAWARIRRDFFSMFYLSLQPQNNQFTNYWSVKSKIITASSREQEDIKFELALGEGFLGTKDCSKDRDGDGKIQSPEDCITVTPGQYLSKMIFGEAERVEQATLSSQVSSDMLALSAMSIDLLINQFIGGVFQDINKWARGQSEKAAQEYTKASGR